MILLQSPSIWEPLQRFLHRAATLFPVMLAVVSFAPAAVEREIVPR